MYNITVLQATLCIFVGVLLTQASLADSVPQNSAGGFGAKQETPSVPFEPPAGIIEQQVNGQLPPINEELTITSGAVKDKTANENPYPGGPTWNNGDPRWWDDNPSTSVQTGAGSNKTIQTEYVENITATELRISVVATGYRRYDSDEGDRYYGRSKIETITVGTASGRSYSRYCGIQHGGNGNTTRQCNIDFGGRTEKVANITWEVTADGLGCPNFYFCRGSGAGIADVSPVVPGGYYKPQDVATGYYNDRDRWFAFRPDGRTFLPNISGVDGPFNIYKDEVLYCTGRTRLLREDEPQLIVDDVGLKGVREHADFCLGDWEGYSGFGSALPRRRANTVLDENRTNVYRDEGILPEDMEGPNNRYEQVSEAGPEFRKTLNPDNPEIFSLLDMKATGGIQVRDSYNVTEVDEDSTAEDTYVEKPQLIDYQGNIKESIIIEQTEREDGTIETFELMSLFPTGNTWITKDNGQFFGGEQNTATRTEEESGFHDGSEGWIDVKQFNLNLKDHERTQFQAELLQGAPDTRSLENYRFYHKDSGTALVEYNNIEEDGTGFTEVSKVVNTQQNPVPSGEWTLQMKANQGSRNVELGVKNLVVETDEDIAYDTTETFEPQLNTGSNTLEVNTEKEGVLDYTLTWTECRNVVEDNSPNPTENGQGVSLEDGLSLKVNCDRDLTTKFYNSETGALLGQDQTDSEGQTASSGSLSIRSGTELNWYAEVCDVDQDACHRTDTYSFSTGTLDRGLSNAQTQATPGFAQVVRDEDFNQTGQKNSNRPSSRAYVNKIEDDSDQLETGPKWNNSNGSEENADQYALTPSPAWTISNRGKPYPPPSDPDYQATFYRNPSGPKRTELSDDSIPKTRKVFGNSLGVVADQNIKRDIDADGSEELIAREGTGVWIDPDEVEKTRNGEYEYTGPGNWRQKFLSFNMDITGPDSGLGYDRDTPGPIIYQEDRKTITGDIHWQKQT